MWTRLLPALLVWMGLVSLGQAQETRMVEFPKHVQPILEQRCLSCHGPKEAKNDFRVDDLDSLTGYLEPGDAAASTLWTDYLTTDDPEMLMPPATATEAGGLPIGELLVLKTWMDEGAIGSWASTSEPQDSTVPATETMGDLAKWWAFQGLFHPATVHFPVALLSVSALFVFFSFFQRDSCEPVAYHCLWIGALGAALACAAGWSYATYKGYAGVSFDFENSGIDRHRWAGVFVAVFAFLVIPLARSVRQTGSLSNRIMWLIASVILALGVSLAGYQGGELTYGEDHYMKYYRQLFPETPEAPAKDTEAMTEEIEERSVQSAIEVQESPEEPVPAEQDAAETPEPPESTENPESTEAPQSTEPPESTETSEPIETPEPPETTETSEAATTQTQPDSEALPTESSPPESSDASPTESTEVEQPAE